MPSIAHAQPAPPCQFAATLYGCLLAVSGMTHLPSGSSGGGSSGASVDIDPDCQMKSGRAIEDLNSNGPGIPAVFDW